MNDRLTDLASLREEIDNIDKDILRLIQNRLNISSKIGNFKQKGDEIIRPGREAQILRACAEYATDFLPREVILSIWRELITASCLTQSKISISVCAPDKSVGYWSLARDHFGTVVPMKLYKSPKETIQLVSNTPNSIGLIPSPEEYGNDQWWTYLVSQNENFPKIIGKLPFMRSIDEQFEDIESYIVSNSKPEFSGKDKTWIVLELNKKISFDLMQQNVRNVYNSCSLKDIYSETQDSIYYLFEMEGFYNSNSQELIKIHNSASEIKHVYVLGSFAY